MTSYTISLGETTQFSPIFLDYLQNKEQLRSFYGHFPAVENFGDQLRVKSESFSSSTRETLYQTLEKQYSSLSTKPDLAVLKDRRTFTVTTGHQLNIFTGPLYVIYKLVTTVNLAKALKVRYPDYHFVPVYWMATEDHDLEEINHFHLFGKKHRWETTQTGAVGRMNPQDMESLIRDLPEKISLFERAYLQHDTLADATRYFANELFGQEGLICVDGDDRTLKAQFVPVMRDDLTQHTAQNLVKETSQQLESLDYKTQVNAREINLFYLGEGLRERIIKEEGQYKVLNTELVFSEKALLDLLGKEPEKFSPNVVLRPLYQETVLPNLAYIGGPAEVVYWLQLKALFDHYQIPFPVLMPRNFALIINKASTRRMQKLNLSHQDLFLDEASLKRRFVEKNAEPLRLDGETDSMNQAFDQILEKALKLDKTLEGFVQAERQKLLKSLDTIDKRLKKAEEKNQETEINQLLNLKARLFPNGGLQERSDNYLNFALNNNQFIQAVSSVFNPFDFQFHILTEA